jgi:hypothetical protein
MDKLCKTLFTLPKSITYTVSTKGTSEGQGTWGKISKVSELLRGGTRESQTREIDERRRATHCSEPAMGEDDSPYVR